jgi:hypothetical protein
MTQIVLDHLDEVTFAKLSELAKLNRLSVEQQAEKIKSGVQVIPLSNLNHPQR